MRLRIPRIGFTAWFSLIILVVGLPFFYVVKKGYLNKTVATPLGIMLFVLIVLLRLTGLVNFIKTEGKKDIREVFSLKEIKEAFSLKKPAVDAKAQAQLRKWEKESDPRLERLPASVRRRIESLEIAYVNDTSARTTLSLAKAYEECGLQDVAQLYYDQLLHDFRWSKEARVFRKTNKKNANRPIT